MAFYLSNLDVMLPSLLLKVYLASNWSGIVSAKHSVTVVVTE